MKYNLSKLMKILKAGLCPFPSCRVSSFFRCASPIMALLHHAGQFVQFYNLFTKLYLYT